MAGLLTKENGKYFMLLGVVIQSFGYWVCEGTRGSGIRATNN